jgi:hypothetical protein
LSACKNYTTQGKRILLKESPSSKFFVSDPGEKLSNLNISVNSIKTEFEKKFEYGSGIHTELIHEKKIQRPAISCNCPFKLPSKFRLNFANKQKRQISKSYYLNVRLALLT